MMNKMKLITFFLAGFISFSGYGQACYSISGSDQLLTISVEPSINYIGAPFNQWSTAEFTICWDASLGDVIMGGAVTNLSSLPFVMGVKTIQGGRYYQKVGFSGFAIEDLMMGVPLPLVEITVTHGSIADGDFLIDEMPPIVGGDAAFSNFAPQFASGSCNLSATMVPLPVELTSFSAKALDRSIQLKWESETEEDFSGYEIQRSTDKQTYKDINWVEGLGGLEPRTYKYEDNQLAFNQDYYYRLKMIDTDGSFEYSPIRTASIEGDKDNVIVYPNPVRDIVHVDYTSTSSKTIDIQIINISGQIVAERNVNIDKGGQIINLDIMRLPEGIYNLRMLDEQGIITKQIAKF